MKVNVTQLYAKEFKPITVTITIESFAELRSLTARCDLGPGKLGALDERIKKTFTVYGQDEFERVEELWYELDNIYAPLAVERGIKK
jgi:hypothetical protein